MVGIIKLLSKSRLLMVKFPWGKGGMPRQSGWIELKRCRKGSGMMLGTGVALPYLSLTWMSILISY